MARPNIMFAMLDGMVEHFFSTDQRARLAAAGEILDPGPCSDFATARARTLLAEAEVIVGHWGCPTLTPEVLEAAPRLRMLAYAAGTVKWQVTDAVWERDVLVTSAAAANAVPVSEYAVAMILLANKGVLVLREQLADPSFRPPIDLMRLGNVGARVGIVGASFVGRLVIDALARTDLVVSVYDPFLAGAEADTLGVEKVDDLNSLCAMADVLSIHAPDIPPTRAMIGAPQLACLRDGATVLNTARPALIDQDALQRELESGRLSAILDVTDPDPLPPNHPLLALPNAFITPHVAGAMGNEYQRLAELAVEEVERYAAGRAPRYPVRREDIDRIA